MKQTTSGAWCGYSIFRRRVAEISPQKGGPNPLSPNNYIAALAVVRQGSPYEWEAHTDVQRLAQAQAAGPNPAPLSSCRWLRQQTSFYGCRGKPRWPHPLTAL